MRQRGPPPYDDADTQFQQGRIHDCSCRGGWAGAVIIWAGACFPTLKMPKNAKKAKCDGPTDGPTDGRTDGPTERPTDRHGDL